MLDNQLILLELPLSVISPTIDSLGNLNEPDLSAVRVSWNANPGNYDLKHYTVTVYSSDNDVEINSINISEDSDTFSVVLPVPNNIHVYAKIRTTSHCLHKDNEAITDSILSSANSSGKCLYV